MVSTCVILSGMTNIVCLLYVGWVTNYIANMYIKVPMPVPAKKLEGDRKGETLRIIERLDRLENVVNQHIQGKRFLYLTLLFLERGYKFVLLLCRSPIMLRFFSVGAVELNIGGLLNTRVRKTLLWNYFATRKRNVKQKCVTIFVLCN